VIDNLLLNRINTPIINFLLHVVLTDRYKPTIVIGHIAPSYPDTSDSVPKCLKPVVYNVRSGVNTGDISPEIV